MCIVVWVEVVCGFHYCFLTGPWTSDQNTHRGVFVTNIMHVCIRSNVLAWLLCEFLVKKGKVIHLL